MEKFWAVILIFVVVAAAGLMYVNEVYIPQKDTQTAMAEMAKSTLSAVKQEIGDGNITIERRGNEIIKALDYYLEGDSDFVINIGGADFSNISGISGAIEDSSYYRIEIIREEGKTTKVNIKKK